MSRSDCQTFKVHGVGCRRPAVTQQIRDWSDQKVYVFSLRLQIRRCISRTVMIAFSCLSSPSYSLSLYLNFPVFSLSCQSHKSHGRRSKPEWKPKRGHVRHSGDVANSHGFRGFRKRDQEANSGIIFLSISSLMHAGAPKRRSHKAILTMRQVYY